MTRSLSVAALSLALTFGAPVLAQVQLDHATAQKLTDLGIDTSAVVEEDDVGYIDRSSPPSPTTRRRRRRS